jgi:predicted choloylglycine hydrolase
MTGTGNEHQVVYRYEYLQGTAYEIGKQQAEAFAQNPAVVEFFTSPHPQLGLLSPTKIEAAIQFFDRYCPGLNEEIQGFADGLNVPLEKIVFYAYTYQQPGSCSQFVVLPSQTKNGHMLVGRSYEFNHTMCDMRLVKTEVKGKASHLGFSEVTFGRDDGINEHGLCVTMSMGAPMAPTEPGGCTYWALLRTILDRCTCVEDALEVAAMTPVSFNLNMIVSDRSGQAALVEMASSHRAVKRINPDSIAQWLIGTNHYVLPEMFPYDNRRMWNSVRRYQTIENGLRDAAGEVTVETIRNLLNKPIPDGVCGHYYTEFFGTLWSEVIDVTEGRMEVCFGTPVLNPWHSFHLDSPSHPKNYPVVLPDVASDPKLWQILPPGSWLE